MSVMPTSNYILLLYKKVTEKSSEKRHKQLIILQEL